MMEGKMRETGIDFLGPLPWGTHFCLFYETKEDLIEILVPYFKLGLENNQFCMWVTSDPLKAQAAKRALRRAVKNLDDYIERGQIEILEYSQWYTKSGRFEADEVLQGWVEKEHQALKRGFDGLRLAGNTFGVEKGDWKDFAEYEEALNDLILEHRMLAICTYSLHRCGASEIMDVVSSHQFATIRHNNKWEAVENAEQRRAQEALQRLNQQLAALLEIAAGLETTASPTELATNLVRALADRLGYPFVGIWLLEGNVLKRVAEVGYYAEPLLSEFAEIPLEQGIIGRVARTGQPAYVPDVSQDSDFRGLAEIRSEICCPLRGAGGLLGVLDVESCETLTEADFALVQAAARLSATALSDAQLFGVSRRQAEELATLYDVSLDVAAQLEIQELLQTILERAIRLLNARGGGIYLYNPAKREVELQVSYGLSKDYTGTRLALGEGLSGKVAETGEPLMVDDYQRWEGRSPLWEGEAIGGVLGVPLKRGDDLLGVLTIDHAPGNNFQEGDSRLATLFANQAAIAIENARLYEETKRRAEELAALNAIAMTVSSTLDLQEVLQAIQERVMNLLGEKYAPIFALFNEGDETFEVVLTLVQEEPLRRVEKLVGVKLEKLVLPLSTLKPAMREALLAGKPYVTDDGADFLESGTNTRLVQGAQKAMRVNSLVDLPLWVKGKLIGAMVLLSQKERVPDGEMELLSSIANQAAIAIENARLFNGAQQRITELATINQIGRAIASTMKLDELWDLIYHQTCRVMEVSAFYIALHDQEREELQSVIDILHGQRRPKEERPRKFAKGRTEHIIRTKKPLLIRGDVQETYRRLGIVSSDKRARAFAGVPITAGSEVIGVLAVQNYERDDAYDEHTIELLSTIANQAAIAIENARLYEQTDEKLGHRVAELTALNVIAQSLTRSLELDEILESIVTHVAQVMQARICTIRLVKGNELTVGAAVGYRDEASRQHTIKIDKHLARIVRDQQPLVVEDLWVAKDIPPSRRMRAWREEVHSFLGVPMISKRKTIGVLSIYREKPHRFTEEKINLLLTIANQAAIAIEDARLYEKVREHAEELERLVQERTKELQAIHAELLQSAKLAALGQLAAGVAHELNNPLGAISGYLELLQEEMELGPQEMDYMERIEKRIQQSTKIVAELRSLGTPSEPVWQIVNVNDILEGTLSLVERRLSFHQIKVQKDITPALPLMHADPDRLEQVFINLITNARQAMEEGGTLRVASRESRNGEWVEIIFADTGEGIAKEHLDKIFDPFFTTRSPGKGMGLGLSLSHRQIKDHGGAIDVWSEKGRGTVFRVALPPSGAKRCWEIIDCDKKERCKAVRENAAYRCWSVMEDVSRCKGCEVYRKKALLPLDGTLLPQ